MKKSIPCCPLKSKPIDILVKTCFDLVHISLLIQKSFHGWITYGDDFISCLDSHFDGTQFTAEEPLMSDVMLNFSKSVPMKKQTHLHLAFSKCSLLDNPFL